MGLSAYAPETVSFVSTLSSSTFAKLLRDCRATGYQVVLFYVTLPTSVLATQRVALRVKQGGHHIPTVDIHRRFQRSLNKLFELYLPLSDRWAVLDNASGSLEVTASGTPRRISVKDSGKWLLLRSIAQ